MPNYGAVRVGNWSALTQILRELGSGLESLRREIRQTPRSPQTQLVQAGGLEEHITRTSNVHGADGSVVGTTDSQILTNKRIDGAQNTVVVNFGTTLPSPVPTQVEMFVLDRRAPQGSILYVSLPWGASMSNQWEWWQLLRSRD